MRPLVILCKMYDGEIKTIMIDSNGYSTHSREDLDYLMNDNDDVVEITMGQPLQNFNVDSSIKLEPIIVRYDHAWVCGGPEEGGWYYSHRSNPVVVDKHIDNTELYRHQMQYETFDEWVVGVNATVNEPIYQ